MMRIRIGDQVVEGALASDFLPTLQRLGVDVATKAREFFESRVLLGHVLRELKESLSKHSFDNLVMDAGIHRRRVTEAMRVAEEVGMRDGRVDWGKYRQLVGDASRPSVRAVIARAQARVLASRPAAPEPEEGGADDLDLLEAEIVYDDEGPMGIAARASEDDPPVVVGESGTRVRESSAGVLESGAHVSVDGSPVVVGLSGTRVLADAAGQNPGARVSPKGAAGEQLGLGMLYERAIGQLDGLRETLQRLGLTDLDQMASVIRERLTH